MGGTWTLTMRHWTKPHKQQYLFQQPRSVSAVHNRTWLSFTSYSTFVAMKKQSFNKVFGRPHRSSSVLNKLRKIACKLLRNDGNKHLFCTRNCKRSVQRRGGTY